MFELVCHQRYRAKGVPVDLSPYGNHGRAFAAGRAPGPSGDAIAFRRPDSRVELPFLQPRAFAPLGALRIEAVLRIPDPGAAPYLTVVDAYASFRLAVDQGAFTIACLQNGGGLEQVWAGPPDAPDGRAHPVPPGRWVRVVAEHDGFAHLRLWMDDRLVAQKVVSPAVRGVDPVGKMAVTIGNSVNGGEPLLGTLDEIRIWRLDPRAIRREFLCRPMTPEAARCWEAAAARLREWVRQHPQDARALYQAVREVMDDVNRRLFLQSPDRQEELRKRLRQMIELWCRGATGGRAMEHALRAWREAQRAAEAAPGRAAIGRIVALAERMHPPDISVECDPEIMRFLDILRAVEGGGRGAEAV